MNNNDIKEFFQKDKTKYFLSGIITAHIIKKLSQTKYAHDLAVGTTATIMNAKDNAEETIENIREDAEDIQHDAKNKIKKEALNKNTKTIDME